MDPLCHRCGAYAYRRHSNDLYTQTQAGYQQQDPKQALLIDVAEEYRLDLVKGINKRIAACRQRIVDNTSIWDARTIENYESTVKHLQKILGLARSPVHTFQDVKDLMTMINHAKLFYSTLQSGHASLPAIPKPPHEIDVYADMSLYLSDKRKLSSKFLIGL